MRVLVTGAAGQLGSELMGLLASTAHVVGGITHSEYDLTVGSEVDAAVDGFGPEVVLNCAAWTAVDAAEDSPIEAHMVNGVIPALLALACRRHRARLIHISTDYVFDGGTSAPIPEEAAMNPLSAYGSSKALGELAVRNNLEDHVIVRSSWLYGQAGPNFVLTMLRLAQEKPELRVVSDQYGCPTWTKHLAEALIALLDLPYRGTLHVTNSGATTWYEFATAIIAEAGLQIPVRPIATSEYPTPAMRPRYTVLASRKWRELGMHPLPDWRRGLHEYVASLKAAGNLKVPA